ncbi:MAG: hypothetical protein JNM84_14300 [Planctomycetes bacterium]|nr:hypothetical protein [Planctomycetota bacterium]
MSSLLRSMLVLCLASAALPPVSAQDNWVRFTPTASPAVRQFHAMAFDAVRREFVLFGGFNSSFTAIGDTWTFNGTTWTRKTPTTSPSARGGHRMVFDAARGEIVLFGGGSSFGSASFNDLWTWDGSNWTNRTPTTRPSARFEPVLCYDQANSLVVLFGGGISGGLASDTWTWNGSAWTQLAPATPPAARSGAMSTYDASRQRVVIFGGGAVNGSGLRRDLWEWDGTSWTNRTPTTTPAARFRGGLAYDPVRKRCLLFGGFTPFRNDTWSWDGATGLWTQLTPSTNPLARDAFGFEYDPDRGCIYMFGGDGSGSAQNDSWRWCSRGLLTAFGNGCAGNGTSAPLISAVAPAIGTTWTPAVQAFAPNTPVILFAGLSNTSYGALSLPFDLGVIGFTGCSLLVSLDLTLNGTSDGLGVASFPTPLPRAVDLLGAEFHLQATTGLLGWTAGRSALVGH